MTERHRGNGTASAATVNSTHGRLEVVLAAGSLMGGSGEFIDPRRELKKLRAPKNLPLTAVEFQDKPEYKERYLDPFQLPGHSPKKNAIRVYLVRVSKRAPAQVKEIRPTRKGKHRVNQDRPYTYPTYVFDKLPPGKYDIHVETVTAHQCLPDAKVRVYVVSTKRTKRVVIVLSTDTIGQIASAKGIKIGAAGIGQDDQPFGVREFNTGPLFYTPYPMSANETYSAFTTKVNAQQSDWPLVVWNQRKDDDNKETRWHLRGPNVKAIMANALLWTTDSICDNLYFRSNPNDTNSCRVVGPFLWENAQKYVTEFVGQFHKYADDLGIPERQIVVVNEPLLKPNLKKSHRNTYTIRVKTIDGEERDEIRTLCQTLSALKKTGEQKKNDEQYAYEDLDSSLDRDAFYRFYLEHKEDQVPKLPKPYSYIVKAFDIAADAAHGKGKTMLILNEKKIDYYREPRTEQYCTLLGKVLRRVGAKYPNVEIAAGLQMHVQGINEDCKKDENGKCSVLSDPLEEDIDKQAAKRAADFRRVLDSVIKEFKTRNLPPRIMLTEMAIGYYYGNAYGDCTKKGEKCTWTWKKRKQGMKPAHRRVQRKLFYRLLQVFFSKEGCDQVTFWGFDDTMNEPGHKGRFKQDRFGLLFDKDGCTHIENTRKIGRKPAYFGVLQALIEAK